MSKITYTKDWVSKISQMYMTGDIVKTRMAVIDSLDLRDRLKVLDIGCGTGFLVNDIKSKYTRIDVQGVDISKDMVEIAGQEFPNLKFSVADVHELPFESSTIDRVASMQTFAYLDDPEKAVKEVFRILQPGGRFVLLDTDYRSAVFYNHRQDLSERAWEGYIPHCKTSYVNKYYRKALEKGGFNIVDAYAIPIVNVSYDDTKFGFHMASFVGKYLVDNDIFTDSEVQEWHEDLKLSDEKGEYYFSMTRSVYVCEKEG